MAQRLTNKMVQSLSVPPVGNRIAYDDELRGFGARVTAAGAKAFILNYRINGRERRYTIGGWPEWNTSAARDEAKRLKRDVDLGIDPLSDRLEARNAPTIGRLCDDYLERHAPKKRTGEEDRRKIERTIRPRLGRRLVAEIGLRDIEDLHRSMTKTPYEANRTLAVLSKMFSLAVKWGWRANNPCHGVEKFEEQKRERYLSRAEIGKLSDALAAYEHQGSANVVRLLMLTGARRGEVLKARWEQFDLEKGEWIKPSAHTKTKKTHRVPLSAPVRQLLAAIRETSRSEWVFPGRDAGHPLTDIKKCWAAVSKAAEIDEVRLHDLRHTYASILASSGLSLPIIGRLLGHTQPSTTARYAHLYDDPLREATDRVGAVIEGAATGGKDGEVIQVDGRR